MRAIYPVLVIVGIYILITVLDSIACSSSWKDSGYNYKYSIRSGCMISVNNDNRWIPQRFYRKEE